MKAAALLVLAACGGGAPPVPQNVGVPGEPAITIGGYDELGWLGLAPAPAGHAWIPEAPTPRTTVILPSLPAKVEPGMRFTAVDARGTTTTVEGAGQGGVRYGCDRNELEVTRLEGARPLAPGVVWMLAPTTPSTWSPRALAIEPAPGATPGKRAYRLGAVTLDLARTGDRTIALAARWHQAVVGTLPYERSEMDGGTTDPVDLVAGGVGVPVPVAAWQLGGARGAVIVALHVTSWEGEHVGAIVVEPARVRWMDELGFYMYRCAF